MNDKELEKLYRKTAESETPDMDALWSRIENSLPEKTNKTKKKFNAKIIISFAITAAALTILIPAAYLNLKGMRSQTFNSSLQADNASEEYSYTEAAPNVQPQMPVDYNSLSLAKTESNEISFNGKPYGDEFFAEDAVLEETDAFVDGVVDKVYSGENGECVYYELTAREVYSGEPMSDKITVASCSEFEMKQGREYFIPLKSTSDGLKTVFDNAPQIEITLDKGLIFYNGWKTLDSISAQSIIYPRENNNSSDYFYDRMKLSYSGTAELIDKWKKLKN